MSYDSALNSVVGFGKKSRFRDGAALALMLSLVALPLLITNPILLISIGAIPLVAFHLRPAVVLLLIFISFSYFRLHEAYPALLEYSLPFLFGTAGQAAFVYAAVEKTGRVRLLSPWPAYSIVATVCTFVLASIPLGSAAEAGTDLERLVAFAIALLSIAALYSWLRWLEELDDAPWGPEMWALAAFFAVLTIGMPFAREFSASFGLWLGTFWKIIATTVALAWLLRSWNNFVLFVLIIIASGALVSAVAIYNGLNGFDLVEGTRVTIARTLYLSPEELLAQEEGREFIAKARSLLADPNDLALVLLFPLGFAAAGALKAGLPIWLRLLCWLALPVQVLALLYTQSRGGALGMIAVGAVILFSLIRHKIIGLALVGALAVALFVGMSISDRQVGGGDVLSAGLDDSAGSRLDTWRAALNMTAAHPLTGVGMNNYPSHSREYASAWLPFDKATHSTWFAVLSETGIPGFLIFIFLFVKVVQALFKADVFIATDDRLRHLAPIRLGLTAGLAGFAVSGTFLTQHLTWALYIQIGIAIALSRHVNAQLKSTP